MIIAIGSDHGGFELKERLKRYLEELGYAVQDFGCYGKESVDYPDYAKKVACSVSKGECQKGLLICRNGIGMSIAANRFRVVRAATCFNEDVAMSSREHDDTNVLCLGADFVSEEEAKKITLAWLKARFDDNERRVRRIKKIEDDLHG